MHAHMCVRVRAHACVCVCNKKENRKMKGLY